ncbi:Fur family transcriptional regulator [Sulfurospirillum arcachonense]|uniref:Fur family transcriptional regulator n=1 Tax=Sulfurospirillum arcachonense TaxID=57666 RepID=UPI000A056D92|nr:transcriptional repressor [Sulfurospirillum arcachonense]
MQLSRIIIGDGLNIENIVKKKNLKLTSARRELLEILFYAKNPLSYEDIKENIVMDKATFYRNIIKFEEENIINSFESNDKKRYFEIFQQPHPHFVCSRCHNIECIKERLDFNLEGYLVENIILKGLCKVCNKTSI